MDKHFLVASRDCLFDAFTVRDFISFCKYGKNTLKWAYCVQRKMPKRNPLFKGNYILKAVENCAATEGKISGDGSFDDNDRKEPLEPVQPRMGNETAVSEEAAAAFPHIESSTSAPGR
ncbi:uncharacterized protein LOC121836126 [Ixodes scapularis]|uniref:uncharacterized protein LOC121836126 n=1 Tax=Ixodes scapularis TaxID=6945 RepID=UPI001C38C26C|nr:uncharacterized protein LOC121836126 [Ixodes scapularis]